MRPPEDPRTRILLSFLLGIALPSGLLGYLAWRGIQNDRALVERERRIDIEEAAVRVDSAVRARIAAAGRAVAGSDAAELSKVVRKDALVEAVFILRPAEGVRMLATDGVLFARDVPSTISTSTISAVSAPGTPTVDEGVDDLLRSARELELRTGDLRSALGAYRTALEEAPNATARAQALGGVARVQRKLGLGVEAAESYQRLRSEFGDVAAQRSVPPGAAASRELASVLLQIGDTARARDVLLQLHEDLVAGRWTLTPARFDLLTTSVSQALDSLARAGRADEDPPIPGAPADGSRRGGLAARTAAQQEKALALLDFEDEAALALEGAGPGARPFTVHVRGRDFAAVLLAAPPASDGFDRRGFVIDLGALARGAASRAGRGVDEERGRLSWTLRTPSGEVVESSPPLRASDGPITSIPVAGFAPWTLELAPTSAAADGSFLTSRRAAYLYAFVLLAGILLFGLTLTIRSVGRELELARMKSDFVSTVTHEFKSPLTAIRQIAEMLRSDRVPSEVRRRRYHDVLLEQSERLSRLVDNVLDLARMESGRQRLSRESVDPADLVEHAVADARQRVAHEGFRIRHELEGLLPRAHLDPGAIRQALGNLIDNGVKYSGSSREVVVRGYTENGDLVLAVRDFGIGLAPEEADRVFDRFYRAGDELTRSVKGTGLGLTLVKEIVDAHGGRIAVTSEPGEGSTFCMRFPLDVPDAADGTGPTRDPGPSP